MTGITNTPPVVGIAGWKNSGKTTLVVRLVEELTA
jgi:molybdopterin-guanine dinucleotide biosynthesis protein